MQKTPIPDIPTFGDPSPRQNPIAQTAYRLSWRGIIPPLGAVLGPISLLMGMIGVRRYRANPKIQGYAQARMAVILGAIQAVSQLAGLYCLARHFGWFGS